MKQFLRIAMTTFMVTNLCLNYFQEPPFGPPPSPEQVILRGHPISSPVDYPLIPLADEHPFSLASMRKWEKDNAEWRETFTMTTDNFDELKAWYKFYNARRETELSEDERHLYYRRMARLAPKQRLRLDYVNYILDHTLTECAAASGDDMAAEKKAWLERKAALDLWPVDANAKMRDLEPWEDYQLSTYLDYLQRRDELAGGFKWHWRHRFDVIQHYRKMGEGHPSPLEMLLREHAKELTGPKAAAAEPPAKLIKPTGRKVHMHTGAGIWGYYNGHITFMDDRTVKITWIDCNMTKRKGYSEDVPRLNFDKYVRQGDYELDKHEFPANRAWSNNVQTGTDD
jgi:hypothetical protein